MSPVRPGEPDTTVLLNDAFRRLRAVERSRTAEPVFDGTTCVRLLGNGDEGDPYRYEILLDPRTDNAASCEADGLYVPVGVLAAPFDAVVDGSLPTDAENRIYAGIGECLEDLFDDGYSRAFVLVRGSVSVYTETANWNAPAEVTLVGVSDAVSSGHGDKPNWNHAGFSQSGGGVQLHNMAITFGTKTSGFSGGSGDRFLAEDCGFDVSAVTNLWDGASGSFEYDAVYRNCFLTRPRYLGSRVRVMGLFFDYDGNDDCTIAGTYIVGDIYMNRGEPGGVCSIALPVVTRLEVTNSGGGSSTAQFEATSTSADIELHGWDEGVGSNVVLGNVSKYRITGSWNSVTLAQTQNNGWGHFHSRILSSSDISGPCNLAVIGAARTLTLRGPDLVGTICLVPDAGTGTMLDFINADRASLVVATDGSNTSGAARAYSFDAASTNNVLVIKDVATFPSSSVDAGTGNRVLPEGTTPYSVNGHVVEDEGSALTQRATMNFVGAGVTATDAGGKTVVTIPGGGGGSGDEPSVADWISL